MSYKLKANQGFTRTLISALFRFWKNFLPTVNKFVKNQIALRGGSEIRKATPNLVSGFTLIELLIVLAIVGILSGIVLANLRRSQSEARDRIRLLDMQTLETGLKIYYDANKSYPKSLRELVPEHLSNMPIDPKSSSSTPINYAYTAIGSEEACDGYHLGTTLENANGEILQKDADAIISKNICAGSAKDFNGSDNMGCPLSLNGACYDVRQIELKLSSTTTATSTTR